MIAFIILHYKNIKDTLECIDSIESLKFNNYKIIVVENGSLDTSTEILRTTQDKVEVVFNKKNYGFAKGNNCGIKYARKKFDPKYYIVINNDIIVQQESFLSKIIELDKENNFDVLGPKIITNNKINQNPNYQVLQKKGDIIKHIIKLSLINLLIKIHLYHFLKKLMARVKKSYINENNNNEIAHNVPLHGSALIFSQQYVKKYKETFDESTFLYGEEEFLNYRRVRDNLKFIYAPNIEVYHKEDASLNEFFKDSNIEKSKFVIRNSRISLMKLLRQMFKDKFK